MKTNLIMYRDNKLYKKVEMKRNVNNEYIYKWNVEEKGSYSFSIEREKKENKYFNATYMHTAPFNKIFDAYVSETEERKPIGGFEEHSQVLIVYNETGKTFLLKKMRFERLTINPSKYEIEDGVDIYLAASFNDWNPKLEQLERVAGDHYYIELALEEGNYEFKLVANKKWYPEYNETLIVGEIGYLFPKGELGNGKFVYNAIDEDDKRKAIKHDFHSLEYMNKIDENEVNFSIRTQMNDVEEVVLHIQEEDGIEEIFEMYRILDKQRKFDYFRKVQKLEINSNRFRYYFELIDGGNSIFFAKNGLVNSAPTFFEVDFNLLEFYIFDVPKWAKEAIWYNIFPERFYNGDLNNDPLYNEFGPSIYTKPHNRANLIDEYKWTRKTNDIGEYTNNEWTSDFEKLEQWEEKLGMKLNRDLKYARMYGGDLRGVKEKIPYIKELGINAIWLNPVFFSETNHKYGANDFRHISPDFGVMQTTGNEYGITINEENNYGNRSYKDVLGDDFNQSELKLLKIELAGENRGKNRFGETENPDTWVWTESDLIAVDLIKELHKNGIRVIFDGAFNHCGLGHWSFEMALIDGENSKYSKWHKFIDFSKHKKVEDSMNKEEVYDVLLHNLKHVKYNGWAGFNELPEFDSNNAEFKQYMFNITKKWLLGPDGEVLEDWKENDGIDGFRLDVPNCLENQDFWFQWRKVVKNTNRNAYITAELWDDARKDINSGKKYDTVMNYEWLKTTIKYFINQEEEDKDNKSYKLSAKEFLEELKEKRYWYPMQALQVSKNLNGSHDTDRLLSRIVNDKLGCDLEAGKQIEKNYNTIRPDLADNSHENTTINWKASKIKPKDILKLISIFQMTYIGAPMLYYGDEVGMWGATDPYCRKPMLWEEFTYDDETDGTRSGDGIKYEVKPDFELFDWYKKIIEIRKENPVLVYGNFFEIVADNENDVIAYERSDKDNMIIVIINNGNEDLINYEIETEYRDYEYVDLLSSRKLSFDSAGDMTINLRKKFGLVLKKI